MACTEIRDQVDALPADEQDKLAAYLTMLRKSREPAHEEQLSRRLSDEDPNHWVSLETLKANSKRDD